jgi:uncharacterized protein (DUF1810 family)
MDDFEDDDDELEMFVEAQDTVWPSVISELSNGRKQSHWMWFVFPQLAELGSSDMAKLYGIHDLSEAEGFLGHPVLKERLLEVVGLILTQSDQTAEDIFGSLDAQKLQSSMTLFSLVPGAPTAFQSVLDRFFDGQACSKSRDMLS